MIDAKAPKFMNFKTADDLIRVGRNYDGGYLVSKKDLLSSDFLISCGISEDWSFEEDFCAINNVKLLAYDRSVSKNFFFKKAIFNLSYHKYKKFKSFTKFFQGKKKHIHKFIGPADNREYVSISTIFNSINKNNVFLKIDIEGGEYPVLDQIIQNQNRISGIVIEFHDVSCNINRIENFINKLNLNLVHIHANNYAPINKHNQLAEVLELTFSKHAEMLNSNPSLPHKLDMPNSPMAKEIALSFID